MSPDATLREAIATAEERGRNALLLAVGIAAALLLAVYLRK